MKKLLTLAAVIEAATGLALMIAPSLVGRFLLGAELPESQYHSTRASGIALIALGVACWPDRPALCGMLIYGAGVTLYFSYLGIRGNWVGPLLWPAVVSHAVLTLLLARTGFTESHNQYSKKNETRIELAKNACPNTTNTGAPAEGPCQ